MSCISYSTQKWIIGVLSTILVVNIFALSGFIFEVVVILI
jgi:hypothetical protein